MLSKYFKRDTLPCIGALVLLIIMIIIAINMSGSIKYDKGHDVFQFTFNHLMFGNSKLVYEVEISFAQPVLKKASETCVKEVVNMSVGCVPIIIITVVASLLIGIGSILVTAKLMDSFKQEKDFNCFCFVIVNLFNFIIFNSYIF